MTYIELILGYLILGVITMIIVQLVNARIDRGGLAEAFNLIRKQNGLDIATILGEALAHMVTILAWPYFLFQFAVKYRNYVRDPKLNTTEELDLDRKSLEVPVSALNKKVSVEEIEADEMIIDPLGYSPSKPFGFRNEDWNNFKRLVKSDDEIWNFDYIFDDPSGLFSTSVSGYGIKNSQKVKASFISSRQSPQITRSNH